MATTFAPGGVRTVAEPVPELGFNATASPAWLMVPADPLKTKTVMLTDDVGLSLRLANSAQTGIVTFKEQPSTAAGRPILLTGIRPGTVRLEAQDKTGAARATLEITVKAQKKLATFIHFVFDKSGRSTKNGVDGRPGNNTGGQCAFSAGERDDVSSRFRRFSLTLRSGAGRADLGIG